MTGTKEQVTCKMKWGTSCVIMNRSCAACGKDGIGMITMAGDKARREEVEYIRRHKMYTIVHSEVFTRDGEGTH